MASRPSLPFQITFGRPNWRFQIHGGSNQQILLSQWLQQGQNQVIRAMDGSPESLDDQGGQQLHHPPQVVVNMNPPVHDDPARLVSNQQQDHADPLLVGPPPPPVPPRMAATNNLHGNPVTAINMFLEQNPEVYNILRTLLTYIPFLVLIFFKEICKHFSDLLVLMALAVTFVHANKTVQREVSKQAKRELLPLAVIGLNIGACIWFVCYMCGEKPLYHSLLLIPPTSAPITLANLMWTATTTDHVIKLGTVLFKALLTALPVGPFPISQRGKYFVFTERSSQLYRALATVPPWIHYLLNSPSTEGGSSSIFIYEWIIGICLCALYLTCKAYKAVQLIKKWRTALSKLFQNTNYGHHPTAEQLQAAGPMCPICHDGYRKAIYLDCKHIFCEECLGMWLDRERTCPMCRTTVAEDPKWKDGSTSYLVQLI